MKNCLHQILSHVRMIVTALLLSSGLFIGIHATANADEEPTVPDNSQLCQVSYTSSDFTSNRYDNLPSGTLQLAVWYDGLDSPVESPILKIEYVDPSTDMTGWIVVGDPEESGGRIAVFGKRIETREFDLGACLLTGRYEVSDVIPNGVVDGLAFGLLARYADGTYDVVKSVSPVAKRGANFVGAWPLGLSDSVVAERAPQLTSGFGREQLRMMLYSAQYLDNGLYDIGHYSYIVEPDGDTATPTPIPTLTPTNGYPKTVTLFVASEKVDCVGVGPQLCLQVKYSEDEEWSLFYSAIEGFEYESGFDYELLVSISEIEDPPADSSSLRYTLIEQVVKTDVGDMSTPTPEPIPCFVYVRRMLPIIANVLFEPVSAVETVTITVTGEHLFDGIRITGPTGEFEPVSESSEMFEFEVTLIANDANIFSIIKLEKGPGGTDENGCSYPTTEWSSTREIEIVHAFNPDTPDATPTPTDGAVPTTTIYYPQLNSVDPDLVAAGESVEIVGSGGYLFYEDSGLYDESARDFDLFFDGERVSTIGCYVNSCRTMFTLPADAMAGVHQISVEGGSTITLEVDAGAETPLPIVTMNYTEGAPGSTFRLEGSGFAAEEQIQIAVTGMTDVAAVQSNESGAFTLLLTTNNLASGLYELSIQSATQDDVETPEGATITIGLDESHPRRAVPTTDDVQELTIGNELGATIQSEVFFPFLQMSGQ